VTTRRHVVDASTIACWYFADELTTQAETLLVRQGELLAPDLVAFEIARLLGARLRRGEISAAGAATILAELQRLPVEWTPSRELAPAALELAQRSGLALGDAFALALALQQGCRLVTADRTLFDEVGAGPLAAQVVWVGSLD
jgi:predicted nucleic acid-binding protein